MNMTRKELQEELENYPEDWEVVMWGGTFMDVTAPVSPPVVATAKIDGKTVVVLEQDKYEN